MKLPKVGDSIVEDGKRLQINRVFTNNAGVKCVEYVDDLGLHGCVLPEYWFKKVEAFEEKQSKQLDGQAGSGAPS